MTKAFGKDLAAIEKAWHQHLDKVPLRAGVLSRLGERHARSAAERNPGEGAAPRCLATAASACAWSWGQSCQALLLRGQGTFVYVDADCVGHARKLQLGTAPVEIVLRRVRGKATVWIDGQLAVEATVPEKPAPLGIGCVGDRATVRAIGIRKL